jgi:tRNA pseudouridine55 synthase
MPHEISAIGILNIDKPSGWTSHDVVARLRRVTGVRRIGHAGALDPLATGVLVVCIGAATRLSDYFMSGDKHYRATVHLGIETDSWDAEGEVVARGDASAVTRERFGEALAGFVGEIEQTPPMYSALKRDGQPLYRLARRGEQVTLEPRPVTIHQAELTSWEHPVATIDIVCSKGTYVRSLAHDLGAVLGCGAHLAALRRLRSGRFAIGDAVALDALDANNWRAALVAPWEALADRSRLIVSAEQCGELLLGRAVELPAVCEDVVFAFDAQHTLIAVLIPVDAPGRWRPTKVLAHD